MLGLGRNVISTTDFFPSIGVSWNRQYVDRSLSGSPGRDYDDRRISNLKIYNIIKKSNMSKITKRLEELRVRSEKHNRDLMDIASEVYEKHLNTHSEICDNLNKLESYTDQHDPSQPKSIDSYAVIISAVYGLYGLFYDGLSNLISHT